MIVKTLEFTLENCEAITIPGYYVGDLYIEDIKTTIRRIACDAVAKYEYCENFAVEIHADANKQKYRPFGTTPSGQEPKTIFERLAEYDDITCVDIVLTNNEFWEEDFEEETGKYTIWTKWVGDSEYENKAQKSIVTDDGHLYLVISKDETIGDFFADELASKEMRDSKFKMFCIGDENHKYHLEFLEEMGNVSVEEYKELYDIIRHRGTEREEAN